MDNVVIDASGVSKVYRIGMAREEYKTARDAIVDLAAAPFRRMRDLVKLSRFKDAAGEEGPGDSEDNIQAGGLLWALRDVSFQVSRGEVLGVIGRNGAGKSTLLKVLSRITPPTQGRITLKGRVGSLLEVGTGFHPELTGRENVFLNGAILGMSKGEIHAKYDDIVAFAEIERFMETPVKRYSSGMRVRLAFAVAANLEPEILLVDEVLAVGDMAFQKKCLGKMSDVTKGGRTVLFVSHNMSAIATLTERCLVLDKGRVAFLGSTDQAIQHYIEGQKKPGADGCVSVDEIACERRVTLDPKARFLELGLSATQTTEISVGGSLVLDTLLETTAPFEEMRFGYSIRDEFGGPVLSGFTPAFPLPNPGRHGRRVQIMGLVLGPGSYELCLSLNTGGLAENKYVYDIVFGFGRFGVAPFFPDGVPLGEWHRDWGRVVHTDSEVSQRQDV